MNTRLMLVSSDKNFYGTSPRSASQQKKYFSEIYVGTPSEESLADIRRLIEASGILGIVTRGSWTVFLKKHLTIPVFPIKIDAADIYRHLDQLSDRGYRKVGLAIYSYASDSNAPFGEIDRYSFGNLQLLISHVNTQDEIDYVIERMVSIYKADYILGDVETVQTAMAQGVECGLISLEPRFLVDTIAQARYMVMLGEKERAHNAYINAITNMVSEAIVSFSPKGTIVECNTSAEHILRLTSDGHTTIQDALNTPLEELTTPHANKILNIHDKFYVSNVLPLVMDDEQLYTLMLNDVRTIQKIEMSIRKQSQESGLLAKYSFDNIVAQDPKTVAVMQTARRYARSQGAILIRGETGTGKEILASSIHNESMRRDGPFVALNCATLSENLIESELFGYEKGAFTGASTSGKKGLFELAHRGTIFLDEIGDMPLHLQAKLLRVLQEHEVMHLGGNKVISVDVRVIAATNRDLYAMMEEGHFRQDLFYRLALLEFNLPPLRERPGDIIPLFTNFLSNYISKTGVAVYWDDLSVFEPLLHHHWPGNIRELENFAERTVLLSDEQRITRALVEALMEEKRANAYTAAPTQPMFTFPECDDLHQLEQSYLQFLLQQNGNNREALCAKLGISRPTLWRKLSYQAKTAEPSGQP